MTELHQQLVECADDVWRIAYRLLNNDEDARECYQQSFLDALRLDASSVRDWRSMLCKIATRRAMDQLRRRYRDQARLLRIDSEPVQTLPPDARLIDRELCEEVRNVLSTLPSNQAEAFWLRHIEQLSQSEVAEQLELQPGHVRVLVHRAVVRLREVLGATYSNAIKQETSCEDSN